MWTFATQIHQLHQNWHHFSDFSIQMLVSFAINQSPLLQSLEYSTLQNIFLRTLEKKTSFFSSKITKFTRKNPYNLRNIRGLVICFHISTCRKYSNSSTVLLLYQWVSTLCYCQRLCFYYLRYLLFVADHAYTTSATDKTNWQESGYYTESQEAQLHISSSSTQDCCLQPLKRLYKANGSNFLKTGHF